MIFSSLVRWSSRCRFLTGGLAAVSATSTSISVFKFQCWGAIIVADFSDLSRTAVMRILLGTPMARRGIVDDVYYREGAFRVVENTWRLASANPRRKARTNFSRNHPVAWSRTNWEEEAALVAHAHWLTAIAMASPDWTVAITWQWRHGWLMTRDMVTSQRAADNSCCWLPRFRNRDWRNIGQALLSLG